MRGDAPRRLHEWLLRERMTQADFAKLLEIAPETLSRLMNGRLAPSKVVRIAVEHVTGGAVPERSWLKDEAA